MILNKRGLYCDMAEDGEQASQMIHKNVLKYHLIFMDNMMPNMVNCEFK